MKKKLHLLMLAIMSVSLVGCNGNVSTESIGNSGIIETSVLEERSEASEETSVDGEDDVSGDAPEAEETDASEIEEESSEEESTEASEEEADETAEPGESTESGKPISTAKPGKTDTDKTEKPSESQPNTQYTFTEMGFDLYALESVTVRDLPCKDGKKLGTLAQNDKVTIISMCNETGWFQFNYKGKTGYVASGYFGIEPTSSTGTGTGGSSETKAEGYDSSYANNLFSGTNSIRQAEGLSVLSSDSALTKAANTRAKEIVEKYEHTRPNGSSCNTALSGTAFNFCAENICMAYEYEDTLSLWNGSSGHAANMRNDAATYMGVGTYYKDGIYYSVQLFATKTVAPTPAPAPEVAPETPAVTPAPEAPAPEQTEDPGSYMSDTDKYLLNKYGKLSWPMPDGSTGTAAELESVTAQYRQYYGRELTEEEEAAFDPIRKRYNDLGSALAHSF